MTDQDELRRSLFAAFVLAIADIGIARFKQTSFFARGRA